MRGNQRVIPLLPAVFGRDDDEEFAFGEDDNENFDPKNSMEEGNLSLVEEKNRQNDNVDDGAGYTEMNDIHQPLAESMSSIEHSQMTGSLQQSSLVKSDGDEGKENPSPKRQVSFFHSSIIENDNDEEDSDNEEHIPDVLSEMTDLESIDRRVHLVFIA